MSDCRIVNRLTAMAALFLCAIFVVSVPVVAEEQQDWEPLTEIQPYGPLLWDMSIKEALDAIDERWPEARLFVNQEDRQLITRESSLFEAFVATQRKKAVADVAEYDFPVSLSYIQLQIEGITLLDQPGVMTLSFTSVPALIASRPDRIVYIETDHGKAALPMVLYQVAINCSAETASDAEMLKDSLESSLTKRFAPYRDVTPEDSPEVASEEFGGYINGLGRIRDAHQARRFNSQSNWEAWSKNRAHAFRAGYTVHQHEDTTTGFSAQLIYTQSQSNFDYRAEYVEYVEERRAKRSQRLIDISEDL